MSGPNLNESSTLSGHRPATRMKVARAVGFVLLVVAAVYFGGSAWKYANDFPPVEWNVATAVTFATATFAYMTMYATSGIAWHLWLKAVREPSRLTLALALWMLSQFAKYVPG